LQGCEPWDIGGATAEGRRRGGRGTAAGIAIQGLLIRTKDEWHCPRSSGCIPCTQLDSHEIQATGDFGGFLHRPSGTIVCLCKGARTHKPHHDVGQAGLSLHTIGGGKESTRLACDMPSRDNPGGGRDHLGQIYVDGLPPPCSSYLCRMCKRSTILKRRSLSHTYIHHRKRHKKKN
jgi:hypothetical protein